MGFHNSGRFISILFSINAVLLFLLLGVCNTKRSYPTCYTALFKLEKVHKTEGRIVDALLKHYADFDKSLWTEHDEKIHESVIKIRNDREIEEETKNLFYHPIDQFHFLKRIFKITNPMLEDFSSLFKDAKFLTHVSDPKQTKQVRTSFNELLTKIRKLQIDTTCWPDEEDYEFSINSFVQLIELYKLSKSHLAHGEILGHRSVSEMTIEDTMDVLEACDKLNYYQQIVDWCLFLVEDKMQHLKDAGESYLRRVYRTLANNYYKNNQIDEAIEVLEKLIRSGENDQKYQRDLAHFKEKKESNTKYPKQDKDHEFNETYTNLYDNLCRSDIKNPILGCKYVKPMQGWYLVKQEVLSTKPYIAQFYDVIFTRERQAMRELAKTRMFIPGIEVKDGKEILSKGVVHEAGYLHIKTTSVIEQVENRMEFITGLNIRFKINAPKWNEPPAENFYVTNYGLANKESATLDYVNVHLKRVWPDNRIATLRFYVSEDDIYGGATIFPEISRSSLPIKGSAILWYNLLRNGQENGDTLHAECPVLLGSKWTSTKWIHERQQFLKRPCSLSSKH